MPVTNPLGIGVAVLNWNGYRDTITCLDSLLGARPRPARVVVVDNASADASITHLRQWVSRQDVPHRVVHAGHTGGNSEPAPAASLTILRASTNRGFAGGNNLALRWLERDGSLSHFLLLNNDATVAGDFFSQLERAIAAVPAAGLVGTTILEAADRERVWYAGGHFHLHRALVLHDRAVPPPNEPVATEFVTGCAMLISRDAYRRVGPLAECYYPLYMEDAEYSYRVGREGLPVIYAPAAVAYHKVGATVGLPTQSTTVAYCANRHRGFFVRRNLHGRTRMTALAYLIVTKPVRALAEALSGRPRIAWAVLRGTLAGLLSPRARQETLHHE